MKKAVLRKDWYDKVWLGWDKNKIEVEKNYGTHPFGGGHTEEHLKPHPEVMKDHPYYKKHLKDLGLQILLTITPEKREPYKNYCLTNDDLFNLTKGIDLLIVDKLLGKYSYRNVAECLINWYDRLVIGGTICIITPDLKEITKRYISNTINFKTFLEYLYGNQMNDNNYTYCSFDDIALKTLLTDVGFSQISIEREGILLKAQCRKERELSC